MPTVCRALALATAIAAIPLASTSGSESPRPGLEEILAHLRQTAGSYVGRAKQFSCLEVVRWKTYDAWGKRVQRKGEHRSNYLFTGRDDDLDEIRAPRYVRDLESIDQHMDRSSVPLYVERAYFWILVFDPERHGMYTYALDGFEVDRDGTKARVRFSPVPPVQKEINEWHGTVLVDLESWQILRAEGRTASNQQRMDQFRALMESDEDLPLNPDDRSFVVTEVTTDFGVEKNGLRFPSAVNITKTIHRVRGAPENRKSRTARIHDVRQVYKDYRFYNVAAESTVNEVGGEPPPIADLPEPVAPPAAISIPAVEPAIETGLTYHEPFDGATDDPDAIFDWEERGWLVGPDAGGVWEGRIADGSFHLSNTGHEGEVFVQSFSAGSDSQISVRVMLEAGGSYPRASAGLLFRHSPQDNTYYAFLLTHRGELRFVRRTASGFFPLYTVRLHDFAQDTFFELQIIGRDDEFLLMVDGRLVTSIRDSELASGPPGIVAIGRGAFAFDELKLY